MDKLSPEFWIVNFYLSFIIIDHIQSKTIFALKAVNLQNQSERAKNDLIKEIVFLEKLKNCNGVVKVK